MLKFVHVPFSFVVLASAVVLTSTCGSSPTAPSPVGTSGGDSGPAPGSRTFTVMTFNVGKGSLGTSGKYNLKSVADVIAKVSPDIVGVQELVRNDERLNCDDQPARLNDMLREATGRVWTYVYAQEWWTQNRICATEGRGDGPQTEGLAILAPEPLSDVAQTPLYNSRIVLSARTSSSRQAAVAVTHLANSSRLQPDRVKQIAQLLPWTASLGTPRWVIGDFNARPNAEELLPVLETYRDAWLDASAAGTARGNPTGATLGTSRVDYIFYLPSSGVRVVSAEVVDTAALVGRMASDHAPVVATFQIP